MKLNKNNKFIKFIKSNNKNNQHNILGQLKSNIKTRHFNINQIKIII